LHFKWKIDTENNLSPDWVSGSSWQEAPAESGGYGESLAGEPAKGASPEVDVLQPSPSARGTLHTSGCPGSMFPAAALVPAHLLPWQLKSSCP